MSGSPGRFQVLTRTVDDPVPAPADEGIVIDIGTGNGLERERRSLEDLTAGDGSTDGFLRQVLAEQNGKILACQTPRQLARIARTVEVELEWGGGSQRVLTLDLSAGGFRALLASPPPLGEPLQAYLRLRRGERVAGVVQVAGVRGRRGSARVSFAFHEMAAADRTLLERYVVDQLLSNFRYRDALSSGAGADGAARLDLGDPDP